MKQNFVPYIYILFLFFSINKIIGQNIILKLASKSKIETEILHQISYQKKHNNKKEVYLEIDRISSYLKQIGYLLNELDSVSKTEATYTAFFKLKNKTANVIIKVPKNFDFPITEYQIKDSIITISIEKLQQMLESISVTLDNEGKSFSEVQLKNIHLKGTTLFADLKIITSKKRKIDTVFVKGYENFSKAHIKHYLHIRKNTVFNKKKITQIASAIQSLKFVEQIKPPETLFTKDSTLLYIYIKKRKNNSFDGLINFTTKESGRVLFNGYLDLKFSNILNTGESFNLFWNRVDDERQDFKVATEVPYIFNTVFSPEISFAIYKQDSTFLSTKFYSGISYALNSRTKLSLTYDSESSVDLKENTLTSIKTFNNFFLGMGFLYEIPNKNDLFDNQLAIELNGSYGKRKTVNRKINQFKIKFSTSYIWNINYRTGFYIRNETGYLNSEHFLDNELFRIGGANSIRGFNEQSLFASKYSYFNTEYRYLTSQTSYIYSIIDFGAYKNQHAINTISLLGFGLGYFFRIATNSFQLNYVAHKTNQTAINLNTSKVIVNWKTFF